MARAVAHLRSFVFARRKSIRSAFFLSLQAVLILAPSLLVLVVRTFLPAPATSSRLQRPATGTNWDDLRSLWEEGVSLDRRGYYRDGVMLKREALSKAYTASGMDQHSHAPHLMSPWFTWAIGHIGLLAMFAAAQNLNLVPANRRTLLIGEIANKPLLEALNDHFDRKFIHSRALSRTLRSSSYPRVWPQIERLEMVRSVGSFIEIYQLWETVWQKFRTAEQFSTPFRLSEEYRENAHRALENQGIDFQAPIVSIHLRQSRNQVSDERAVCWDTYLPAISALLRNGYQVVRFGADGMRPLPEIPGLVDLASAHTNVQVEGLLLEKSEFLVSTHSGPFPVAMMMGTRALVTNSVNLGVNTLSGPPGSLFLPKHHRSPDSHHRLTLSEILQRPIAFSHENRFRQNYAPVYEDNSAEEILDATMEMVSYRDHQQTEFSSLQESAMQIRRNLGAISFGPISEAYLAKNSGWVT